MATLVVPGVSVEARFDVLPPLPAAAGILGVIGVVDRLPRGGGLVGVTKAAEIRSLLGPGTESTMPQLVHALANGAREAIISPVAGGTSAALTLRNRNAVPVVTLRCRAPGAWGNGLAAEIREVQDAQGNIVRVTVRLLLNGQLRESFDDLQVLPGAADDLFDVINQRSKLVVAIDPGFAGAEPVDGTFAFQPTGEPIDVNQLGQSRPLLRLLPGAEIDPTGLSARIDSEQGTILVEVFQGGLQERFTDLVMDPDSDSYLPYALLRDSRLLRVQTLSSQAQLAEALPSATVTPSAFTGGVAPTPQQYQEAIELLVDDSRIDLVFGCIDPGLNDTQVRQVHQALVAHAVAMADAGAPRIAFGSVTTGEQPDLNRIRDHAASVRNRRFVLVSPAGAEGAVAGAIGRMNPQDSPTFKPIPLFDITPARYRESQLNRLLGPTTNALVVQDRVGRGVVCLKGIDTTGDQVSVTRVADQCIRETRAIAENFIGRLNTDDARVALRQQIVATFLRMERDGAIVPSTDGTDPSFHVDVYSTQLDFAQGIVRIDIAVRPVRAIDYVYATIRVKN
jgi:Phage tail sheath C-terminal domain